jgi:biotin transport system substrate-specific component
MISFVDLVRPLNKSLSIGYDLLCIFLGSLFLGIMSQLSVDLWFTPVPMTMQTLAVLLIGALLGSKKGVWAVIAYLGEGAMGMPVFAGGSFGVARFCGPTGGYLFAFILCAWIVGYFFKRGWGQCYKMNFLSLILGTASIYAIGYLWLSCFFGFKNAFFMGVYPFLGGAVIQLTIASILIPSGWRLFQSLKQ